MEVPKQVFSVHGRKYRRVLQSPGRLTARDVGTAGSRAVHTRVLQLWSVSICYGRRWFHPSPSPCVSIHVACTLRVLQLWSASIFYVRCWFHPAPSPCVGNHVACTLRWPRCHQSIRPAHHSRGECSVVTAHGGFVYTDLPCAATWHRRCSHCARA